MALPTLLILPGLADGEAIFARPSGDSYSTRRVKPSQFGSLNISDLYVILPGQTARIFETELPKAGRAQQLKMARFAREDDIASSADDLHFALSDAQPPRLAIVDKLVMERLNEAIAGLRPRAAYVDYDLLEGEQAILVLDRAVEPGQAGLDLDWVESELVQPSDNELAALFEQGLAAGRGVNLLQGEFRPRSAINMPRPALIRFGALAAVLLVVGFIWNGVSDSAKLSQAEALRAQTASDYLALTGVRAPSSPGRAAAQSVKMGPSKADGFMDLSAVLFAGMSGLEDILVDQIRYNAEEGTLGIRFIYPSFDAAGRAETAIAQAGGRLTTGGVRERDGTFVGEATLSLEPSS